MQGNEIIAAAAAPFRETCRTVSAGQLDAPTPCAEFTVRQLVNHLLFWGPSLRAAAAKVTQPPPAEREQDVDLVNDDWREALLRQTESLVSAWQEPAAWEGSTHVGGAMELPGAMVGGMVLTEFVVHGWDLARATGTSPDWDADVLKYALDFLNSTAELGRQYGAYGPAVPVPAEASTLDVALGLSGRDPGWVPA